MNILRMKNSKGEARQALHCSSSAGFTLVESLIYTAIFAITAVFLVSILSTITRTQLRRGATNEVNQELSFVAATVQRYVRASSMIANPPGVPSSTLVLRMSSSVVDTVKIYTDVSSTAIYLEEIPVGSQTGTPVALTTGRVRVGSFLVTKYENPGGLAVAQIELTLNYNTENPLAAATRSWRSAVARISAATFDSSLLPNADALSDLGSAVTRWRNLYLSGDASVPGSIGIGTTPPTSGTKLKATGNLAVSSSSYGMVLMSPNSTCYRLGVSNAGAVTTTTVACP